jgi:sulfide dehydrogenase cytochrome subunit
MRTMIWISLGLCVALPAQAAADEHARSLAATCAACHGTNGESVGGNAVLAGLDRAELVHQMKSFKSGRRRVTIMHQLMQGYSDDEIEQLADFFAGQKRGEQGLP